MCHIFIPISTFFASSFHVVLGNPFFSPVAEEPSGHDHGNPFGHGSDSAGGNPFGVDSPPASGAMSGNPFGDGTDSLPSGSTAAAHLQHRKLCLMPTVILLHLSAYHRSFLVCCSCIYSEICSV